MKCVATIALASAILGCAAHATAPVTHGPAAAPAVAAVSPATPPATPAPKPLVLPPMHEETLENGLHVLLIEDHELPVVSLTLQFPSGAETESRDRAGLASLAIEMLREGTKTHSAEQISEAIDFVGGSLGANADDDSLELTAQVLRKDFDVALGLLAEEVLAPVFPKDELEDARRQMSASVKQRYDDPGTLAHLHAQALALGDDDPYSFVSTEKSVAAITREDLFHFHDQWLVPGGATLAIAGDIDASILPKVRAAFAAWRKADVPANVARRAPQKAALRLVDKDELTQSFVTIALPGIDRRAPDFYAARVMETIFSDGFSSRLTKVVRTENGKTYDVSGSFELHVRPATFVISTSTRTSETVPTLALVMEQMKKLQSQAAPITAAELGQAKAILIGGFPRRFETPEQVSGQILWTRRIGIPLDELTGYRERIASVTLEQANAAAKKYLDASQAVIVVCGRASEVKSPLEKAYGPVEVVDFRAPITRGKAR